MPDGLFTAIGEDWHCDGDCGQEILAGHQAYVYQTGQNAGQCHCIRCAINPSSEGASERLVRWRASEGHCLKYETEDLETLISDTTVNENARKADESAMARMIQRFR